MCTHCAHPHTPPQADTKDTDRHTHTHADTHTGIKTYTQTDRHIHPRRYIHRHKHTDIHTFMQIHTQTQRYRQTHTPGHNTQGISKVATIFFGKQASEIVHKQKDH